MGILAVILGLLAIACAFLATFLFGTMGGIIAGVMGLIAIVLGLLKRRKDQKGGIPGVVIGLISIILAISLTGAWSNMFSQMREKAHEYKPDGLWAQVVEDTSGGLAGILSKLPKDEATMNALVEEMNELTKITDK